jgi:hypothetical protein
MEQNTSTQSNDSKAGLAADIASLNLYQKLARITGELGAIKKGGTNREQGYAFIEAAAISGELRPLIARYNIVIVPYMATAAKQHRQQFKTAKGTIGTTALIPFTFVVINADKPDEKFSVSWTGEATDYADKVTNKAATAAIKSYLKAQFHISEQGDDPDADSPKIDSDQKPEVTIVNTSTAPSDDRVTPKQLAKLNAMFNDMGVSDRNERLAQVAEIVGHEIETSTKLTKAEASTVIERLTEGGNHED